jgi:hypothetical protein
MPAHKSESNLFGKYANRAKSAVEEHADDPTDYGQMRVPPGINNGVAQLVECKFDRYKQGDNKGEVYFRCAGVIQEPEEIELPDGTTMRVRGLQTSIMEACCDTKKQDGTVITFEEHLQNVMNEMRKLGGEEYTAGSTADDLPALAEGLKEIAPFFRFSTSVRKARKQGDSDGVWENWYGCKGLEEYVPPEVEETVDETPKQTAPAINGKADKAQAGKGTTAKATPTGKTQASKAPTGKTPAGKRPQPAKAPEPAPEEEEAVDLDSLLEAAEANDGPAQNQLIELAVEAGCDKQEAQEAESWGDVVNMIRAAQEGAEGAKETPAEEEEEEEEYSPEVGHVVQYHPMNSKTKKPSKDPVDCEVIACNTKTKTVTLRNLQDTSKQYPNVKWDAVIQPSFE